MILRPFFLIVSALSLALLRGHSNATAGESGRPSRPTDAPPRVRITGELRQWHKITLTLDGPAASERDQAPNPFTDYCFTVRFAHESGTPSYTVPGYFAADGNAAETSAEAGNQWRAHLSPDRPGLWRYAVSFQRGKQVAVGGGPGVPLAPFDGVRGSLLVSLTNKRGHDFRAKGRLQYVGQRYLRFAGSGEWFLKAGADAPESLLAYADFDGTRELRPPGSPPLHRARKEERRRSALRRLDEDR
jgi:hypothetical protein